MQEQDFPALVDRLIEVMSGGPRRVGPETRPRLKALREQSRELCDTARFAEALPLLTEMAEMTANPNTIKRIAKMLRKLDHRQEASRLMAVVNVADPGSGQGADRARASRGKKNEKLADDGRADYTERYGGRNCGHLLRLDKENEAAVMNGAIPKNLAWIPPFVPGDVVLEVGAGEGILSLALAETKQRVIGIDITPVRHEKAKELKEAWKKLGKKVDGCEFVLGDIFENERLFQGVDTIVACHVIYYFIDTLDAFMKLARDNGVRYMCLIGNSGRARRYKSGDKSGLKGHEYYSTIEGMREILERYEFTITHVSEDRAPIVIGERTAA